MSGITDTEVEELREALDHVYGMLPAREVAILNLTRPDVMAVLRDNHQRVAHQDYQAAGQPTRAELTLQQLLDRHGGEVINLDLRGGKLAGITVIDSEGHERAVYENTALDELHEAVQEAALHLATVDVEDADGVVTWPGGA